MAGRFRVQGREGVMTVPYAAVAPRPKENFGIEKKKLRIILGIRESNNVSY